MYISDRIEINDNICGGKPTIRGMRITVQTILELLSTGDEPDDILTAYPMLEHEDISACLTFASQLMNRRFSIKPVAWNGKILVDVNLPYFFHLWNNENYIHQSDIRTTSTDEEIWNYAKTRDLTIITKDSDFSNRILFATPPPRIIHIRLGNMRIKEFYKLLNNILQDVLAMNQSFKLVNVFADRIEGINWFVVRL